MNHSKGKDNQHVSEVEYRLIEITYLKNRNKKRGGWGVEENE